MGDFKNLKEELLKDVQELKEKTGRYKEEKNRNMGLSALAHPTSLSSASSAGRYAARNS